MRTQIFTITIIAANIDLVPLASVDSVLQLFVFCFIILQNKGANFSITYMQLVTFDKNK